MLRHARTSTAAPGCEDLTALEIRLFSNCSIQRRKQAHDQVLDFIRIRRGVCRPCSKTFTILPTWALPNGHYSLLCRQQAVERIELPHVGWEHLTPSIRNPTRLPDPSTLRRWIIRRLVSLWSSIQARIWEVLGWNFSILPTILTWDLPAACRILRFQASSLNRKALDEPKQQIPLLYWTTCKPTIGNRNECSASPESPAKLRHIEVLVICPLPKHARSYLSPCTSRTRAF